ncbi:hypothetical protein RJ639_029221 [Escallonia herrerae]|uniref:Uncharacterized protein n=1 Tax=Escallonia herrerae TaxID=1293975 RepID=A0AA89BLB4_9ASTE|nr:hypothetical protein RJ639_029221 [Escallonia herrerae]
MYGSAGYYYYVEATHRSAPRPLTALRRLSSSSASASAAVLCPPSLHSLAAAPTAAATTTSATGVPVGDSSAEDDCCSLIMKAGKPGNFKMLEPGKPPPAKKARKERNRGNILELLVQLRIWNNRSGKNFQKTLLKLSLRDFLSQHSSASDQFAGSGIPC